MPKLELEPNPKPDRWTMLITVVPLTVLFCAFGFWYRHAHPPYKWPVIPPYPSPAPYPNAYDTYNDAYAMVKEPDIAERGILNPARPDPELPVYTQAQFEKAAADNLPTVAKIREGFRYKYLAPSTRSYRLYSPVHAHDRALARLLIFEGLMSVQGGKWDDALEYYVDAARMGSDVVHEEPLMGPLVGWTCEGIARSHAWDVVGHVSPNAAKIAAMRLQAIDSDMSTAAKVLQSDEVCTEAELTDAFRDPRWRDMFLDDASSPLGGAGNFVYDQMLRMEVNSVSPVDVMKAYTTFNDATIVDEALPYPVFVKTLPQKVPTGVILRKAVFAQVGGSIRRQRESCCTLNELLATMLALAAYKVDHGHYPASLAALVPSDLTRVPQDPFADGKPLTYRLTKGGYLLYSIGSDGIDDHGTPIVNAGYAGHHRYNIHDFDVQSGDIVAGVNY